MPILQGYEYHACDARSLGPETAGRLLEAGMKSVGQNADEGSPARRVRKHTGLVSELLASLSPAPPATRSFLMVPVIIPHFLSILRFLGRPRLLTRVSAPSVGRDIPPISTTVLFRERGPRSKPSRWQHLIGHALPCDVPARSAARTLRLSVTAAGQGGLSLPRGLTPAHSTLEPQRRKKP